MKKLYAGIAAVCLFASSISMASEAGPWKSAYQFPHFTQEYTGCDNVTLGQMKQLFLGQGLPASSWATVANSFYTDRRPQEFVRPFVQGESVLIGLNMRWLGNTICSNPVLMCQSTDKGTCSEMSSVATQHVLQPLWFDGQSEVYCQ